ncbi:MAG: archaeosortase/exosortase family protein [Candidatus Aenigmarchaeota archaeon]|nr:archaeosortase/exosortase family protein [Candidatus Aenigmarchaeota archaeon]
MDLEKIFFRKKLTGRQERLWGVLYFLVRLIILSLPLYLVLSFADLYALQAMTAGQSAWLLAGMGYAVSHEGPEVLVGGQSVFRAFISEDSTAWKSMLFLFALVFAVPRVAMRKRLLGLLWGLPLVWIGNLGRVVGIVLVERNYGIEAAMFAHDFLWRVGLVALVLGLWVVWLKTGNNRKRQAMAAVAHPQLLWQPNHNNLMPGQYNLMHGKGDNRH